MSGVPGVFSFEGDWEPDLEDKTSVRPLLDTIHRVEGVRFIHRRIGTEEELGYYLAKWLQKRYGRYRIGHFAFHGTPGRLWIGKTGVTLESLAEEIGGRAEGRVIYFSSCSTLRLGDKRIEAFRAVTGADAVVGYTKDVGWIASSAFELLFFQAFCERTTLRGVKNWMLSTCPGLVKSLGMRFYHG